MQRDGEASVEEILESIKKVIARDNQESAQAERKRRETVGIAEAVENVAQIVSAPQADDVLDLAEAGQVVPEPQVQAAPLQTADNPVSEMPVAREEEDDTAELVSAGVRNSMRENFAALSMLAEPPAKPQIVRSGETSLEAMTRELLRPMLAEWLDKNLPPLVESMVAREIARIAGKKG